MDEDGVTTSLVVGSSHVVESSERPSKKAKQVASTGKAVRDRRLFTPFRALGIITNHVPLAMQTRSPKNIDKPVINVVTSLGRSWAMWDAAGSIRLLFVGPETPVDISSLLVQGNSVYAAAGNFVYEYVRGKEVSRLSSIDETASSIASTSSYSAYNVAEIILFGSTMCGISEDGKRLFVWDVQAKELSTTIDFDDDFTASHVVHPATYLNKVIVTSKEGGLQIINVQTQQIVHAFAPQVFQSVTSARASAITAVVQSPAIDVLALGFNDGRIVIFDIRMGETLLEFQMSSDSPSHLATVTALSFRTDNEAQTLASSDTFGNIALWDLDNGGRLMAVVRRAHEQHIGSLQFFPGQPILVSSGADNSIREWFFETRVSPPRLLKERSGHASPPSVIRYYGSDGKSMLSASRGDRSLRYTSIVRESRSFELSQGSGTSIHSKKAKNSQLTVNELKLPPIERLAFVGQGNSSGIGGTGNASTVKREWDDVLTAHADGDRIAKTWSVENKRLGKNRFGADNSKNDTGAVKAVCVTACGNFGLVGFERHTSIIVWNMQSGIKRREFVLPKPSDALPANASKRALHVTGIETDALNTLAIVATLKGDLHFFDFHSAKHLDSMTLPSGIVSTQLQRDNNLLACVCDDLAVRLVDIETKRTVREFVGFRGRVIDMTFSNDSRWLLTTSSDSVVRTFDIPTGQLVDVFRTPSMATSISFSPTGDFLATSHVDSVGVYLWTNRAQFSDVSLRSVDENEVLQSALSQSSLPTLQGEVDDDLLDLPTELTAEDINSGGDSASQLHTLHTGSSDGQLDSSLVTLSAMPRHKWQTLINLETITARNKPKEAPKAPESAPFFLPTLPGSGSDTRFDIAGATVGGRKEQQQEEEGRRGRKLGFQEMEIDSELVSMLKKGTPADAYEAFFARLLALTPSALDLEIRSLATEQELILFLQALTARLRSRKDFEAVQAVLNVFLTAHSEVLIGEGENDYDGDALSGMEVDDEGRGGNGNGPDKDKGTNGASDPLQRALQKMLDAQLEETKAVGSMIRSSLGMVAWARGVPVV